MAKFLAGGLVGLILGLMAAALFPAAMADVLSYFDVSAFQ